jgi:hypothetical protein
MDYKKYDVTHTSLPAHSCRGEGKATKKRRKRSKMSSTADQTKLRKRLEALLKKPENQACADCSKRGLAESFSCMPLIIPRTKMGIS